jgi:hypothetical protein
MKAKIWIQLGVVGLAMLSSASASAKGVYGSVLKVLDEGQPLIRATKAIIHIKVVENVPVGVEGTNLRLSYFFKGQQIRTQQEIDLLKNHEKVLHPEATEPYCALSSAAGNADVPADTELSLDAVVIRDLLVEGNGTPQESNGRPQKFMNMYVEEGNMPPLLGVVCFNWKKAPGKTDEQVLQEVFGSAVEFKLQRRNQHSSASDVMPKRNSDLRVSDRRKGERLDEAFAEASQVAGTTGNASGG